MTLEQCQPGRSRQDELAEGAIAAGLALLVAIGFVASWETLRDLAATAAGFSSWLAPVVPLSFDLGIVVLSLKVVLAAREGRAATTLRALVVALSAATVAANATAAGGVTGRLLHAVPPAMFVICFESVVVTARQRALERLGLQPPRLPHVRPLLWLLAPSDTWREWRTAVLAGAGNHVNPVTAIDMAHSRTPPPVPAERPATDTDSVQAASSDTTPRDVEAGFPPGPGVVPSTPIYTPRIDVAVAALRRSPGISAAALVDALRDGGHQVSLRTAQRIKADALSQLDLGRGDGTAT